MKMYLYLLLVVFAFCLLGCSKKDKDQPQLNVNEILKIAVFASGEIQANDQKLSLADLDDLLAENAQKNGVVWYYREAGNEEPPPQAMEALNLIMKHRRPISMSSKPDFSDAIGEDGSSKPRVK